MMGKNREFFIDDRCIISDEVKKMSREQLDREIAELEAEARKEKDRILRAKSSGEQKAV